MRTFLYVTILLSTLQIGCSSAARKNGDTITMDRPVIKNLDEIDKDFKKLQHSLVRLRLADDKSSEESFGTGFFFKSRDVLVTSHHLFDGRECVKSLSCNVIIGFAKNATEVTETTVQAEIMLKDPSRDLIFLKLQNSEQFAQVLPLNPKSTKAGGTLTAAGFYRDNPALTFSQGKDLEQQDGRALTTIVVSSGFSGSPVLNKKGEVVGVVSSYQPIKGHKIGLAQYTPVE